MTAIQLRRLALAGALASALTLSTAAAHASTCSITFGQTSGMRWMPASHAYGIAAAPYFTSICAGANYFNQFNFDENVYNHYHFWADDPTVNCLTTTATWPNGVMGRQSAGGGCVAVDPYATNRNITAHSATHQIRIHATNSNRWRPSQIKVLGTTAARVIVEHTDGTWWYYINLTPGVWNLASTGKYARNAWVVSESPNGGPVWFDNVVVDQNL